jgi:Asp/Glu/hydantoin racemase
MRLLLINPNTTDAITRKLDAAARGLAPPRTEIVAATAAFGVPYVGTRAGQVVAAHAALDLLARHVLAADAPAIDAVGLACFGDPGLLALKEISPIPVLGMAEASMTSAIQRGGRVAIITGGARWVPMLREFVAMLGLADRLAAIRATALTGAEIAADPARVEGELVALARRCVEEDGADVVILGGAGLVGIADRIAAQVPVPVLDSLACLVEACVAAAAWRGAKPTRGAFAAPPATLTQGLGPELARLFARGAT